MVERTVVNRQSKSLEEQKMHNTFNNWENLSNLDPNNRSEGGAAGCEIN
jgi:hypothetical protein